MYIYIYISTHIYTCVHLHTHYTTHTHTHTHTHIYIYMHIYDVNVPWINIKFINCKKNLIFKVWHVKVTKNDSPNIYLRYVDNILHLRCHFFYLHGNKYIQKDGILMMTVLGSVLVTFTSQTMKIRFLISFINPIYIYIYIYIYI